MKKIEAIIRVSQFEEVTESLHEIGIDFLTYWDVTGMGNEKSGAIYRATVYETRLIPRRIVSFVCRDQFVDAAIEAICQSAKTGEMGDGKIFIIPVDESVRIRTGEKGPDSLYIKE
jgi:nitrogen regulatory protein P-II 1